MKLEELYALVEREVLFRHQYMKQIKKYQEDRTQRRLIDLLYPKGLYRHLEEGTKCNYNQLR